MMNAYKTLRKNHVFTYKAIYVSITTFIELYFFLEYNACKANPCMNGATCITNGYNYVCRCNGSWEGPNCNGKCLVTYKTKYSFLVRNVYLYSENVFMCFVYMCRLRICLFVRVLQHSFACVNYIDNFHLKLVTPKRFETISVMGKVFKYHL